MQVVAVTIVYNLQLPASQNHKIVFQKLAKGRNFKLTFVHLALRKIYVVGNAFLRINKFLAEGLNTVLKRTCTKKINN